MSGVAGAVALAAIAATVITTLMTLRHQRNAEDRRRQHERHMRLLESGLSTAVDFLAAASRTTRAKQALHGAGISLDGAKSSSDQQTYDQYRLAWEQARDRTVAAVADAENAYAALRLLVPSAADQARRYLDLCDQANAHPDEARAEREQARQATEETTRQALSGDLPAGWMVAAPAPAGRRKILARLRRSAG